MERSPGQSDRKKSRPSSSNPRRFEYFNHPNEYHAPNSVSFSSISSQISLPHLQNSALELLQTEYIPSKEKQARYPLKEWLALLCFLVISAFWVPTYTILVNESYATKAFFRHLFIAISLLPCLFFSFSEKLRSIKTTDFIRIIVRTSFLVAIASLCFSYATTKASVLLCYIFIGFRTFFYGISRIIQKESIHFIEKIAMVFNIAIAVAIAMLEGGDREAYSQLMGSVAALVAALCLFVVTEDMKILQNQGRIITNYVMVGIISAIFLLVLTIVIDYKALNTVETDFVIKSLGFGAFFAVGVLLLRRISKIFEEYTINITMVALPVISKLVEIAFFSYKTVDISLIALVILLAIVQVIMLKGRRLSESPEIEFSPKERELEEQGRNSGTNQSKLLEKNRREIELEKISG